MLLALDVGNTNITLGLFEGDRRVDGWRLETVAARTEDEYGLLVRQLLATIGLEPKHISGVILASVVPAVTRTFERMVKRLFGRAPVTVGPGTRTGMPILYNPPKDVGADRIVNAVAAYYRFRSACIVVDFGTATTFDSVTAKGEYAGGAIAPGINISMSALFLNAAKLPKVDFARPATVVGKSTVESIQAGTYFGYAGLVDGIVRRMRDEMKAEPLHVIATGGLATVIAADTQTIEIVDDDLTLEGLRLIYGMNAS